MKDAWGVNADLKCTSLIFFYIQDSEASIKINCNAYKYIQLSSYIHSLPYKNGENCAKNTREKKRNEVNKKKIVITERPNLPPRQMEWYIAQNDIIFHRKYMQTDENIKRNSIYHTHICMWHKFVAENYYT